MLPSCAVVSLGPPPSSLLTHDGKSSEGRAWELLWEMVQAGPLPFSGWFRDPSPSQFDSRSKGEEKEGGGRAKFLYFANCF